MAILLINEPVVTDVDSTMDQMLDRAFGRWAMQTPKQQAPIAKAGPGSAPPAGASFKTLGSSGHAFDIVEKKDAYELIADAPGFDVADINVELHQNVLTISGKTKEAPKDGGLPAAEGARLWRSERRSPAFSRSFTLPENADQEAIAASLDKGVLTVHVPKLPETPKPQPRRIQVQTTTA